jgi:hypothetical protein
MADIKQLGDALDEAERAMHQADRDGVQWHDADNRDGISWDTGYGVFVRAWEEARLAYFAAIRKPWLRDQYRLDRKRLGDEKYVSLYIRDLRIAMEEARFDRVELSMLGSAFYTTREYCDAEAAEEAAEGTYEIMGRKLRPFLKARSRFHLGERGKVTRTIRSTTGYKKTGKTKRDENGVRVPIMEEE